MPLKQRNQTKSQDKFGGVTGLVTDDSTVKQVTLGYIVRLVLCNPLLFVLILIFLFNGILTFVKYLMLKPSR